MAKRDLIAVGPSDRGPVSPAQVSERIRSALGWATNKLIKLVGKPGEWNSNRTYWHNHYAHGFGGDPTINHYSVPPGIARAIYRQQRLIEFYGRASFAAGVAHGTNLLAQLAAGTLTNNEFHEKVKRETKVDHYDDQLIAEVEADMAAPTTSTRDGNG